MSCGGWTCKWGVAVIESEITIAWTSSCVEYVVRYCRIPLDVIQKEPAGPWCCCILLFEVQLVVQNHPQVPVTVVPSTVTESSCSRETLWGMAQFCWGWTSGACLAIHDEMSSSRQVFYLWSVWQRGWERQDKLSIISITVIRKAMWCNYWPKRLYVEGKPQRPQYRALFWVEHNRWKLPSRGQKWKGLLSFIPNSWSWCA